MDRIRMVPRTCENFTVLLECVTNCTLEYPTCYLSSACDPGLALLRRIKKFNQTFPLCDHVGESVFENFSTKVFELQDEVEKISKYSIFGRSSVKKQACYDRCRQMISTDVCVAANPWPIRFSETIVKFYQIFTVAKTYSTSLYEFYFNNSMAPALPTYAQTACKAYVESNSTDGAFPVGMPGGQQEICDVWMGGNNGGKLAAMHEDL
ncbi:hypothetical protein AAVH_24578 [Aphelenchoides avenae]|nr:hypothetical protein AAVH_24578 [Aphelenchus avenae]